MQIFKVVLATAIVMSCHALPAIAGDPQQDLLRTLRSFNSQDLLYNYQVRLLDDRNRPLDSLKGRFARIGRDYVDSSSAAFVILKGTYFFKLDHAGKQASLYNLNLLQQKTGLSIGDEPGGILTVPDSTIARHSTLKVDTAGLYNYVMTWDMQRGPVSRFQVSLQRGTYKPVAVTMFLDEPDPKDPTIVYHRILEIRNIRTAVPRELLNTEHYYKVTGQAAVLSQRYTSYRLHSLL